MTQAGVLSLDVVPNLSNLGTQLEQGLNQAVAGSVGTAATKAGESIATKIGGGLQNLSSQIGGELGNLVGMVGRGFDQVGKSGNDLGLKFAAAGGAALGLGTALKSLGSADSAAQQQLQAAITATGNSWGDYQGRIEDAIHAGENFAHNAADTQNALQALTSATGDPAKALKFLSVAFDLAAARHIDLVSAANLVARALNGNTRLLKQYGIDTTGVATSTDKASGAVTKLGDKLSGQAAASVNTFNGTLDVLKTKAGDIVAELSGPVGSALQGFGAATALVGGVIQSGIVQKMRAAVTQAEGFRGKMAALGSSSGVLGKLTVGLAAVTGALIGLNAAFGKTADQGPSVNAVARSLLEIANTSSTFKQFAADGTDFVTTIGRLTDPGVVDRIGNATDAIAGLVGLGNVGPVSTQQQSKDAVDKLDQALTQLVNNGQAGVAALDLAQMDSALKASGVDVEAFHKLLPGYTSALDGLTPAEKAAAAAAGEMGAKAAEAAKAYDALSTSLTSFNNVNIDAQKADIAMRDSLAKVNDALKTSHGSLSLLTQKGRDARSSTLDFAASVDKTAQSLIAEHKPHKAIVDLYAAQDLKLQDMLVRFGLTRAEAKRYADGLLKIPKSVQTKVDLEYRATLSLVLAGKYASGIHSGAVAIGPFTSQHPQIPVHPARGGLVTGAGSTTSDSIPAMLSNREFVLNAKTVQRVGVDQLQRINAGGSPTPVGGNTYNIYGPGVDEVADAVALRNRTNDLLYAVR